MNQLVEMTVQTPVPAEQQRTDQYLTFVVDGEDYAIAISRVREIIEFGRLTTVPMMPEFVRGVINLRGAVVPVLDLGVRFTGRRCQLSRRTCIVILEMAVEEGVQTIGAVVDGVNEVLEIAGGRIESAPAFGTRVCGEFIAGMAHVGDEFIVVLDPDQVLSLNGSVLSVCSGAAAPAGAVAIECA